MESIADFDVIRMHGKASSSLRRRSKRSPLNALSLVLHHKVVVQLLHGQLLVSLSPNLVR